MDHGYGNIKTAHRVFTTGVEAYDEEPIVSTNFVKYREKYYVIGESHLVYQGNKTDSEDFYILTMAGLAEELEFRGLHEAEVVQREEKLLKEAEAVKSQSVFSAVEKFKKNYVEKPVQERKTPQTKGTKLSTEEQKVLMREERKMN